MLWVFFCKLSDFLSSFIRLSSEFAAVVGVEKTSLEIDRCSKKGYPEKGMKISSNFVLSNQFSKSTQNLF